MLSSQKGRARAFLGPTLLPQLPIFRADDVARLRYAPLAANLFTGGSEIGKEFRTPQSTPLGFPGGWRYDHGKSAAALAALHEGLDPSRGALRALSQWGDLRWQLRPAGVECLSGLHARLAAASTATQERQVQQQGQRSFTGRIPGFFPKLDVAVCCALKVQGLLLGWRPFLGACLDEGLELFAPGAEPEQSLAGLVQLQRHPNLRSLRRALQNGDLVLYGVNSVGSN